MIVKMKKVTFMVTENEYDGFLKGLRRLGVVHVEQLHKGASSTRLQECTEEECRCKSALDSLSKARSAYKACSTLVMPNDVTEENILGRIDSLWAQEGELRRHLETDRRNIGILEPWGEFEPGYLMALHNKTGREIRMHKCISSAYDKSWEDSYYATKVFDDGHVCGFMTISKEAPEIDAETVTLPAEGLRHWKMQGYMHEKKLEQVHDKILSIDKYCKPLIEQHMAHAHDEAQLCQVVLSDEKLADEHVHLFVGYVAEKRAKSLSNKLDSYGICYIMEDPEFDDEVPVEIKNGRFSRLFEPILRLYSLPSYHDIDPTFLLAPFFMLFFGLCLGDGGYGLLVLIAGILMKHKGGTKVKEYGKLAIWLGVSTLVCGLAMGTFFGINLAEQSWAFLSPVKRYFISEQGMGTIMGYAPMMIISVVIGLVQVLVGMALKGCKAWRNYGAAYAANTFAWMTAIMGSLVLFGLPLLGTEIASPWRIVLYALLAASVAVILFFNNPAAYKRPALGPLKNLGSGLWNTYNMATGLLGDLLSYIRLFALGLTGGILGGVFNMLAIDLTSGMPAYIQWLPMLIILLLGHGITFALSLISAFVHPMRLTFVEFFKNANFEGGGKAYDPFRESALDK